MNKYFYEQVDESQSCFISRTPENTNMEEGILYAKAKIYVGLPFGYGYVISDDLAKAKELLYKHFGGEILMLPKFVNPSYIMSKFNPVPVRV